MPFSYTIWKARVPLKIKIFVWQLARNKLPASAQIHRRNGPSDGKCAICGEEEEADHIFFGCVLAVFSWSVVREVFGVQWNPANFEQLVGIVQGLDGVRRNPFWFFFCALAWAMWTTRNKFTIEASFPRRPADVIFKCLTFMQLWRPLQKEIGRAHV